MLRLLTFSYLFVVLFFYSYCASYETFKSSYCQISCFQHGNISQIHSRSSCKTSCEKRSFSSASEKDLRLLRLSYPKLLCRSENQLTFWWNSTNYANEYLLELQDKSSGWMPITITNGKIFTFVNLTAHSEYMSRLWAIEGDEKIIGPFSSNWTYTLEKNDTSLVVPHTWISKTYLVDDGYQTKIQWTPSNDDRVCFYDLIWYSEDGIDFSQEEIRDPKSSFEVQIGPMRFGTNYSVGIFSRNGALDQESEISWVHLVTPSCLESYYDLEKCPPLQPQNVICHEEAVYEVSENNIQHTLYDVRISWDRQELTPDNYIIHLTSLTPNKISNQSLMYLTVTGNKTEAIFNRVDIGLHYWVSVTANSTGGASVPTILFRQTALPRRFVSSHQLWTVICIIGITLVILVTSCIAFFVCKKRMIHLKYQSRCKYLEDLGNKVTKNTDSMKKDIGQIIFNTKFETDCWEILPEQILLQSVLGEGAFGLVRKGWLRDLKVNTDTPVAVKLLKDTKSLDEMKHFLHEIEIMKSVGPHPNLVSIIGCCTRVESTQSVMLVVEYCELGDLQNYLRSAWNHMVDTPAKYYNFNTENITKNLVVNKLYEYDVEEKIKVELQPSDLLSFARQIAKGMEFLSNLKVLHRDLAARNVLVCADKSVKVADFGLSRDVYKYNVYHKSGNSKLPIKWMAIESLTHQMFTSQSDVWSFGILLWEIITLGGNPYPSIPTQDLLELLKLGHRMERPSNCGPELYTLMQSCWKTRPKDRPTFIELRKSLDKLLENITTDKYLDLEILASQEAPDFHIAVQDTLPTEQI